MAKILAASPQPARRSWAGTWPTLSALAIGAFMLTSLWAKWDPALGQEVSRQAARQAAKGALVARKATPLPEDPAKALTGGKKLDARALAAVIDREVQRRLDAEGVKPVARADDAEFLRRVYLDLVGVIPPAEKVKAFLNSKDPNKRSAVIDELLANPRFGKWMAEVWTGLMIPRESNNRALKYQPLETWLADGFNSGKPLNQLVSELISATGTQDENGAVTYFVGNPTVDKMTDNVTRMFLGVQLQCAQCHNHPFTEWKQTEYWAMAAFFMKTRLTANPQQAAKKGVSPGIIESDRAPKKKQGLPESAKIVPAKFLQGEQPKLDPTGPYRPVLAKWITSSDNPFFARAMVNRFWFQVFGRGLVSPVDDMHDENAPSHPELLAALTDQFKQSGFDLKYLLRAICNSDAYQRSSRSAGDRGTADPDLYAQRVVRIMAPEQLFDSLSTVIGKTPERRADMVKNKAVGKKGPAGPRDNFLAYFRVEDFNPTDYQNGIPQALRLMNSAITNNTTAAVNSLMQGTRSPAEVYERLYLATLSRRPTVQEARLLTDFVRRNGNNPRTYGDILWALINSSEFVTNH